MMKPAFEGAESRLEPEIVLAKEATEKAHYLAER